VPTLAQPRYATPECSSLSSLAVQVLVRFDPPDAVSRLRKWGEAHAALLAAVPAEAIRIDFGRAVGGDYARVSVEDE
jgi:hypothetical protein